MAFTTYCRRSLDILCILSNLNALPDWVKKYKTKGVEIRVSGNRYYAYEMTSKWNKEKKRRDKHWPVSWSCNA
jgi:hypothetical protein